MPEKIDDKVIFLVCPIRMLTTKHLLSNLFVHYFGAANSCGLYFVWLRTAPIVLLLLDNVFIVILRLLQGASSDSFSYFTQVTYREHPAYGSRLSGVNNMTFTTSRSIHAPRPEPEPEPNPAPDDTLSTRQSDISPADWDAMFDAITERLEACTGPAPLESSPGDVPGPELGMTTSLQATVRDCVVSMNLLHAALPPEWHPHRRSQ